jgi:predicted thioesterase
VAPLLESLCRREMQRCLEVGETLAAGIDIEVESAAHADAGALRVGGWVEQIAERAARFRVRAHAADRVVFEATLHFRVAAVAALPASRRPFAAPTPRPASTQRLAAVAGG